jgi:transposase
MTEHKKVDMRTLTIDQKSVMRNNAIRMRLNGIKNKEVAAILGCRPTTVSTWYKAYNANGAKGLQEAKRGAPLGSNKKMTADQEKRVVKMITDTMPDQLKLPYGLWTRRAITELVHREYGIVMGERAMGNYLQAWGFTPQKPAKEAYEQRPEEVKAWLEEKYPAIHKRAKAENAEIHFGDEVGVRNNCQHGRSYAPIGRTPVRKSMSKKFSVNMISTVTAQGKVAFMVYRGRMNADVFIDFMKRLLKYKRRKVFLIVDNLRVHHSRLVKEWVAVHSDKIELFYLPSYSPQHNPDEYLNCDLKQGISSKKAPRNEDQLEALIIEHMNMLESKPSRVRSYYRHPKIAYAA